VPERYRALIVLGAGAGPRISEALAVTSDRVDWMRLNLNVDRQLVKVEDGRPVFGPLKNDGRRVVPIPNTVMPALVEHVRKFGLGPEGLLFTEQDGGPVKLRTFSRIWCPVARPLGVPTGDGYHQLRHFYASLLIRHGESIKVVAARLGDSEQMVLSTYIHLWPGDEDRTRDAVDEVLGNLVLARDAEMTHESVDRHEWTTTDVNSI
jgi:integrase